MTERAKNIWTGFAAVFLFMVSVCFFMSFTERGRRINAEIAAEHAQEEHERDARIAKREADTKRLQEICRQPDGSFDFCVKLSSDPRPDEMAGSYLHRLAQEKRDRRELGAD